MKLWFTVWECCKGKKSNQQRQQRRSCWFNAAPKHEQHYKPLLMTNVKSGQISTFFRILPSEENLPCDPEVFLFLFVVLDKMCLLYICEHCSAEFYHDGNSTERWYFQNTPGYHIAVFCLFSSSMLRLQSSFSSMTDCFKSLYRDNVLCNYESIYPDILVIHCKSTLRRYQTLLIYLR